jgi:transcriptional antiterminator RfaH
MVEWRLAQVRPNADGVAVRNLDRQGFFTFQPLEVVTTIRGGRFLSRCRSFFPGYLFVSYPAATAPWSLVNSTYGVARLVKFGDRAAVVPASLVAELQAACDDHGVISAGAGVAVGSRVEVASGAFTGFMGEVERLTPDHRALVLMDFLGKQTRANLPVAQLKVASPSTEQLGAHP